MIRSQAVHAVSRALQLRSQTSATGPVFSEGRGNRRKTRGGGRWPAWALAAGVASLTLAALLIGGLTGVLWPAREPIPAETRAERAAEPAAARGAPP